MKIKKIVGDGAYHFNVHNVGGKSLDERSFYWAGLRGTDYYPRYYKAAKRKLIREKRTRIRDRALLKAHPENKVDPFAVGVYKAHEQIGWVGTTMAERMQWHVLHAAQRSIQFSVPVLLICEEEDYNLPDDALPEAYIALPTLQVLEAESDWDSAEEQLFQIWELTPEDIKDSLTKTYLLQNTDLMKFLKSMRMKAPLAALPDSENPEALAPILQGFFHDRRHEIQAEQWELKQQIREEKNRIKEREKEKREKLTKEKHASIAEQLRNGHSLSSIEKSLHTSAETIKKVAHNLHMQIPEREGGFNEENLTKLKIRIEKCIQASKLRESGLTHYDIHLKMKVGQSVVKDLVIDGNFYRNPNLFQERLQKAREVLEIRKNGTNTQSLLEFLSRRNLRDARFLEFLRQDLI